jgi:hypothetical protein
MSEIDPRTGGDDAHLVGVIAGQSGRLPGLRARSMARSGRPTPRSQSAISGSSSRFRAHPPGSPELRECLRPSRRSGRPPLPTASRIAAMRPDRVRAACACAQRSFGIVVHQLAGSDKVASDGVGGRFDRA